jgi:predicted amidophosphoribosyltransferase
MAAECPECGEVVSHDICPRCARELVEAVVERRIRVVNDAIQAVEKEADEVYALDPTRGRGRGPKWMD